MKSALIFQLLFEYNFTLNRYLWDSIMTLSDAQFVKEVRYSHGSIRNHVVHIAGVEARWLRRIVGHPDPASFKPEPGDFLTRESGRALWNSVSEDVEAYISDLTDDQLNAEPPGQTEPVWQILMQLILHSIDHRAQMLRLLYEYGAPTFDQDLILYLMQRGGED